MTINFKKLALAAITLGALSLAALGTASTAAAARTVCDWDGDDCRWVPSYYDRGYGYDWRARRNWEERREHEAWRHRYYDRPYYYDRRHDGPSGGSLWFSF